MSETTMAAIAKERAALQQQCKRLFLLAASLEANGDTAGASAIAFAWQKTLEARDTVARAQREQGMNNDTSRIKYGKPVLCDYRTGKAIRNATEAELAASIEQAKHDDGRGVIEIDGRDCYAME